MNRLWSRRAGRRGFDGGENYASRPRGPDNLPTIRTIRRGSIRCFRAVFLHTRIFLRELVLFHSATANGFLLQLCVRDRSTTAGFTVTLWFLFLRMQLLKSFILWPDRRKILECRTFCLADVGFVI